MAQSMHAIKLLRHHLHAVTGFENIVLSTEMVQGCPTMELSNVTVQIYAYAKLQKVC